MAKTKKIVYWVSTVWLSLGMLSTGVVQLLQLKEETAFIVNLGYPSYFLTIIGVWKLLGIPVLLIPKFPLVKEWAYAGYFFMMSGAVFSHIAAGTTHEMFPALLLLTLTVVSWYFRPANRKLSFASIDRS